MIFLPTSKNKSQFITIYYTGTAKETAFLIIFSSTFASSDTGTGAGFGVFLATGRCDTTMAVTALNFFILNNVVISFSVNF